MKKIKSINFKLFVFLGLIAFFVSCTNDMNVSPKDDDDFTSDDDFERKIINILKRNDIEIVAFAMNCCYDPDSFEELQFASTEIRSNKDFILAQLEYFTKEFCNPTDAGYRWGPVFLKYISDELKQDEGFVKKLIEINPNRNPYTQSFYDRFDLIKNRHLIPIPSKQ